MNLWHMPFATNAIIPVVAGCADISGRLKAIAQLSQELPSKVGAILNLDARPFSLLIRRIFKKIADFDVITETN